MFRTTRPIQPISNPRKTEEQLHYESLINFLKWAIGIAGTLIGIIVSVAIYVSYGSIKDMKLEYLNTIAELRSQIGDLKNDTYRTVGDIKQDSKDAVKSTQDYSDRELQRIQNSTSQIALEETNKQLDNIFQTDKIKDLIQNEAVQQIKSQVDDLVYSQTKDLSKISDAAAQMRLNDLQGVKALKSYFIFPKSMMDSLTAKNLYDQISNDYLIQIESDSNELIKDMNLPVTPFDASLELSVKNKQAIQALINLLDYKYNSVFNVAAYMWYFNKFSSKKFDLFDIEGLKTWFNSKK